MLISSTALSLDDMPEDILHEIAGLLLYGEYSPGWQVEHPDCTPPSNARKDTFALASCCKWMRNVILGRWLLRNLALTLCAEDLSIIRGLASETTDCVRRLHLLPSRTEPDDSDTALRFIDFIRIFPNLRYLTINWRPSTKDEPHRRGLKVTTDGSLTPEAASLNAESSLLSSSLTDLQVTMLQSPKEKLFDASKIEQLRCILQQLQFPKVKVFSLAIPNLTTLHTSTSQELWKSLIAALRECQYPCLEELTIRLSALRMNGQAIGIDFCDALSDVFSNCFQSTVLRSLSLRLELLGEPGDSYKIWAVPRAHKDEDRLVPAWCPHPSQVNRLLQSLQGNRPRLHQSNVYFDCTILSSIVGIWTLQFPTKPAKIDFVSQTHGRAGNEAEYDDDSWTVALLPVGDQSAKFIIDDIYLHSMCPWTEGHLGLGP